MYSHKLVPEDDWFIKKKMVDSLSRKPFGIGDAVVVCSNKHVSLVDFYEGECTVCHSTTTIPFSQDNIERIPVKIQQSSTPRLTITPTHVSMPTAAAPTIQPQYPRYEQTDWRRRRNSYKSTTVALLLCFFLGGLGIHRFYCGKIGTGILYLLTGGLYGIGWIVDIFRLAYGNFTDSNGERLEASTGGKIFAWIILIIMVAFIVFNIL